MAFHETSWSEDAYNEVQNTTIKKISDFHSGINARNLPAKKIELETREIYFLNGVYLYCTLKNGTCPYILETILETDILNSKIAGNSSCPHTLQFWREWIDNSFEERVNYNLGTGFLTKYQDFKKNVRPKYLRCSGTVERTINQNESIADFIGSRYTPGSDVGNNIKRTLGYLLALRQEVPEVFIASGAYKSDPKVTPTPR